MHHIEFDPNSTYKVALLIKTAALRKCDIVEHYIDPIGIAPSDIIAFDVEYNSNNKAPVKLIKSCLEKLLQALDKLKVKTIYVCDAPYFKTLTKELKAEAHLGYVMNCAIPGYEHMKVILGTNHQSLFYNPLNQEKLDLSLKTLDTHLNGITFKIGQDIIKSAVYPETVMGITKELEKLHQYPELVCDIETFSLKFWEAGIGTIGFAWNKHNGTAFCCDYQPIAIPDLSIVPVVYGKYVPNPIIQELILNFLLTYKGKLIYHNANFDIKILIYTLFMKDLLDQEGLLHGLECLANNLDDTKIIAYLAINSCARNSLKLKEIAHEFAGNFAQDDIKNIGLIPVKELLKYNLTDCISTWFVKEKYWDSMVADQQLGVYETIMKPSIKVIAQMELTGMPLDMPQVKRAQVELTLIKSAFSKNIAASPLIKAYETKMRYKEFVDVNAGWKKKSEPLSYFDYVVFNPASNPEMQTFLYEHLDFKVIDRTKTKQPAVGAKTLKKLIHKTKDPAIKRLIKEFIGLSEATKILSTFIEAFINNSVLKSDGIWYLHGSFNLGGTVSGRLSSSGPNLQNIPANSTYAKIIKKCFMAGMGWLMAGADFDSLEDKISALTTKDPNKLKVYIDGFDGHCLRAFSYWGAKMPDIENTVKSINSIANLYPVFRQDSKEPTFALTYQGTWHTLHNNIGLSKIDSKSIEKNYHDLYVVADKWVAAQLEEAGNTGYIVGAFGLRVRTPILKQCLINKTSTPYEAQSESRTAGNALGQSYGLLNNRAAIEFQQRVLASKFYNDIKPIAHIHDAMYFIVRDNIETVKWFNDNLTECMAWQKLPELKHDIVKLSGAVDLFHPNWGVTTKLPLNASEQQIKIAIKEQENERRLQKA